MIVPRNNISVIEDERHVKVKFLVPEYMERCQMYRKAGHYTDVTIHCLHPNSEDVTIYSAHSVLLSAASSYFDFVLVKAFSQLSDLRTNNLRKALYVIQNDNSLQDESLNYDGNTLTMDVQIFQRMTRYKNDDQCGDPYKSSLITSEVTENGNGESVDQNSNIDDSCESRNNDSWAFTVTMRSFISAHNVVLIINGIDSFYVKYVLNCVYSESFLIDKRDINIFLSFIRKMKLTHYGILTELLQPYIEDISCSPNVISEISNASESSTRTAVSSTPTPDSHMNKEDFVALNSFYDIVQRKNAIKLASESCVITTTPLDLSYNVLENNVDQNIEQMSCVHTYASPTKSSFKSVSDNTILVSNALNNNVTNVVYNPSFQNSSCYPYFSSEAIDLNNNENVSISQSLGETNLSSSSDQHKIKLNLNTTKNDSSKRKFDLVSVENLPSTSGMIVDRSNIFPDYQPTTSGIPVSQEMSEFDKSSPASKTRKRLAEETEPTLNCKNKHNVKKVKFFSSKYKKDSKPNLTSNHCEIEKKEEVHMLCNATKTNLLRKLEKYSLQNKKLEFESNFSEEIVTEPEIKLERYCNSKVSVVEEAKSNLESLVTGMNCDTKERDLPEPSIYKDKLDTNPIGALVNRDQVNENTVDISCLNKPDEVNIKLMNESKDDENISSNDKFEFIKCFQCDYSSRIFENIIDHIKDNHFKEKLKMARCVDVNCPVQLLFCSKEWEVHVQHHFETSFFQCLFCSYSTNTKTGVIRHEGTHKGTYKRINKSFHSSRRNAVDVKYKSRVTRNATKNVLSNAIGIVKRKIKSRSNEVKAKNVFATNIFRKLKRGICDKRMFWSSLHIRFFQELKWPYLVLPKTKGCGFGAQSKKGTNSVGKQEQRKSKKVVWSILPIGDKGTALSANGKRNGKNDLRSSENETLSQEKESIEDLNASSSLRKELKKDKGTNFKKSSEGNSILNKKTGLLQGKELKNYKGTSFKGSVKSYSHLYKKTSLQEKKLKKEKGTNLKGSAKDNSTLCKKTSLLQGKELKKVKGTSVKGSSKGKSIIYKKANFLQRKELKKEKETIFKKSSKGELFLYKKTSLQEKELKNIEIRKKDIDLDLNIEKVNEEKIKYHINKVIYKERNFKNELIKESNTEQKAILFDSAIGKGSDTDRNESIDDTPSANGKEEKIPKNYPGIKNNHKDTVPLEEKKRILFNCSFCSREFFSQKSLVKHYYIYHSFALPCKCPQEKCDIDLPINSLSLSQVCGEAKKRKILNDKLHLQTLIKKEI